jgi:hypothetical protein
VLHRKKKAEIQEEAKRLADGSEDSKKWLPHFQTAKRIVKERLTDEEKKEVEDEVKAWEADGVPRDVQGK